MYLILNLSEEKNMIKLLIYHNVDYDLSYIYDCICKKFQFMILLVYIFRFAPQS